MATKSKPKEDKRSSRKSAPPAKRPRLNLSKPDFADPASPGPSTDEGSRFVSPSKSLADYQQGYVPKNTEVNTQWALRNYDEWRKDYNSRHPENPCPEDLLLSGSTSDVSFWLQKYVLGTRKKDGQQYPPKTLYLLLCGLNRYIKQNLRPINIFDRDFKVLFNTCDSYFRVQGIGSESKPTEGKMRKNYGVRVYYPPNLKILHVQSIES